MFHLSSSVFLCAVWSCYLLYLFVCLSRLRSLDSLILKSVLPLCCYPALGRHGTGLFSRSFFFFFFFSFRGQLESAEQKARQKHDVRRRRRGRGRVGACGAVEGGGLGKARLGGRQSGAGDGENQSQLHCLTWRSRHFKRPITL